jgi:hypothetical protein
MLLPPKFATPFAAAATPGTGVRPIPAVAPSQPGAASFATGFPPLNFTPVAAGGIPPFGQDMNGILNQITTWDQWQQAGGPIAYDAAFATSIGGYPRGALLTSTTGHAWFESLVDGNTADPNAVNPVNWRIAFSVWSATTLLATGSANAQSLTLSPVPVSMVQLTGIPINFWSQGTNTGPVTINVNALGASPVQQPNGAPLGAGALVAGASHTIRWTGSVFHLTSHTAVFTDTGLGGVTVSGVNNVQGATLALLGPGATTPNKFIRAVSGLLQVINSAFSTVLMTLTDAGSLTVPGTVTAAQLTSTANADVTGALTANTIDSANFVISGGAMNAGTTMTAQTGMNSVNGNIFAQNGHLQASAGARGTGNVTFGVTLRDFVSNNVAPGYLILPDNTIIQWGAVNYTLNNTLQFFNYPTAFPSVAFTTVSNWGSRTPLAGTTLGSQPETNSQFSICITGNASGQTPGIWYIATGR